MTRIQNNFLSNGASVFAAVVLASTLASCLPPAPENQPAPNLSVYVKWTINGQQPGDLICKSLDPSTVNVEIHEDSDCDGNDTDGFYVYRFECAGGVCVNPNREQHGKPCLGDDECGDPPGYCLKGAGKTGNAFFSGTDTCLQAVLIPSVEDAAPIAKVYSFGSGVCGMYCEAAYCSVDSAFCEEDCYCYTHMGAPQDSPVCAVDAEDSFATCRDLGTIDFNLANFGPLDVDLAWQKEDGTFGTCADAGVQFLGYSLEQRTEQEEETVYTVFDEVSLEGSTACGARLSWPLVPDGYYRLKVQGRNDTGSIMWESDCTTAGGGDLQVDSKEEGSNSFACQVARL